MLQIIEIGPVPTKRENADLLPYLPITKSRILAALRRGIPKGTLRIKSRPSLIPFGNLEFLTDYVMKVRYH
jgi:hypothetical protein